MFMNNNNITEEKEKEKISFPYLTKYEKCLLIGFRIQQINNGSPIMVDIKNIKNYTGVKSIVIAEFQQKRIPFKIKRKLPDGQIEIWDLSELHINDVFQFKK
jgi:DNA-directed RNA polymerase I, II, and III subunit RPABC2